MTQDLLACLDVGTSKVCAFVAEVRDDTDYEILGVGVTPAQGIRGGMIVDVEQAGDSIQTAVEQAERSAGYEIGKAFVGLAGAEVRSHNSRGHVPISGHRTIDQDDIDGALDAAHAIAIGHNREVLHIIPRNFVVDDQEGIRSPVGMHGFRLEVEAHIITASKNAIHNLTKCVESAGVMVEQFVVTPLATAEVALTDAERDLGVVSCDIGGGTTDLAIFIEGNVWHTAVLAVGGQYITNDIAQGLRLPHDVAEQIKIDHGSILVNDQDPDAVFSVRPFGHEDPIQLSHDDLAEIIEPRVEEFFELQLQEIKRSGYSGLLPAGVVLAGGTAMLPGICELAKDVLGLPVRIAEPHDLRGLVDQIRGPAFATSIGLLNWAVRETLFSPKGPSRLLGGSDRMNPNGNGGSSLTGVVRKFLGRLAP